MARPRKPVGDVKREMNVRFSSSERQTVQTAFCGQGGTATAIREAALLLAEAKLKLDEGLPYDVATRGIHAYLVNAVQSEESKKT